jgi:signal transduction histidine kinase
MSLRQQQIAVFLGTVVIIFGIFAAGLWLIAQRLTAVATLQTALVIARQVEIALADSLQHRSAKSSGAGTSFWGFLGNLFPGKAAGRPVASLPQAKVKGLMQAYVARSGSIEAMWVLNPEGKVLYSSFGQEGIRLGEDPSWQERLRGDGPIVTTRHEGKATYYDVLVPLQMPKGVQGPGGLRLWINPADWTELLSGLWHELTFLFVLGGAVALLSAFLTTALYTRRFRLISEALQEAEAGTYQARPRYFGRDEVGKSLDLIDRLVMKQRGASESPKPLQRLAMAARALAHEVRTPLNALAIHLELLRKTSDPSRSPGSADSDQRSLGALEAGIRQVDQLVHDFADYTAPVTIEPQSLDLSQVLDASLEAVKAQCSAQKITLTKNLPSPLWIKGDDTRLRQAFDNLLCNAIEAQPNGGAIWVNGDENGSRLILEFGDSGPGLPLERRTHLFEFGKTTKPGGSGIGLPLIQIIVEAHGGTLEYETNDESVGGSTFRMTLPLDRN